MYMLYNFLIYLFYFYFCLVYKFPVKNVFVVVDKLYYYHYQGGPHHAQGQGQPPRGAGATQPPQAPGGVPPAEAGTSEHYADHRG